LLPFENIHTRLKVSDQVSRLSADIARAALLIAMEE